MTALTLRGGSVWDGLADGLVESDVAIDGGRIARLGGGADGDVVDVTGLTVLPGLIEAHAHLCFNARPDWRQVFDSESPTRLAVRMAATARSMAEAGITTVRDLGAPTKLAIEVRDALRAGLAPGPDLLVAGAPITTTGGHCYFLGGEADGELAVRVAVRERRRAGVDCIKVMATGGNMTPGSNFEAAQYSLDELAAIVDEAARLRLPVAAHCHGQQGIERAVAAGVDIIEHCSFQTPAGSQRDDAVLAAIASAGTIVSPTIGVAFAPSQGERYNRRAALVRGFFEHGCRVVMSTDCGIPGVPHAALAGGMAVLAHMSGLVPLDVLRLATSRSAELLGLPDRGTLAEGLRADILVVDGDPTQDLMALTRVKLVIAGGTIVYRAS